MAGSGDLRDGLQHRTGCARPGGCLPRERRRESSDADDLMYDSGQTAHCVVLLLVDLDRVAPVRLCRQFDGSAICVHVDYFEGRVQYCSAVLTVLGA